MVAPANAFLAHVYFLSVRIILVYFSVGGTLYFKRNSINL